MKSNDIIVIDNNSLKEGEYNATNDIFNNDDESNNKFNLFK